MKPSPKPFTRDVQALHKCGAGVLEQGFLELIERPPSPVDPMLNARMQHLFQQAASPKTFIEIPANSDSTKYTETLRRFLDELPQP